MINVTAATAESMRPAERIGEQGPSHLADAAMEIATPVPKMTNGATLLVFLNRLLLFLMGATR